MKGWVEWEEGGGVDESEGSGGNEEILCHGSVCRVCVCA